MIKFGDRNLRENIVMTALNSFITLTLFLFRIFNRYHILVPLCNIYITIKLQ